MHLLSVTPSACPLPGRAIARAPAVRWRALVSVSNGPRADIARGMRSAANVVSKHRSRLGRRVAVVGGDERGETGGKGGRRKDRNTVRTAARPPTRQSRGFRAVQNRMTLIRIERLSCGADGWLHSHPTSGVSCCSHRELGQFAQVNTLIISNWFRVSKAGSRSAVAIQFLLRRKK
jgi:hypothetical protein